MKKLLLTFTLLLAAGIIINQAKAQTDPAFGIRGGVNFASFNDFKQEVDSRRVGLVAGAYGIFPITGTSFLVQPEVLYTQKGAEINGVEIKFSYIEIPVLVRVNIAAKHQMTPHLYLGPYASFNLNVEEDPPAQGNVPSAEERTNNIVYGLSLGGGVDINSINIGLRYNHDFKNVFDKGGGENTAISIVVGYQF